QRTALDLIPQFLDDRICSCPNELRGLLPSVAAALHTTKKLCRPPHSPQIGTLKAERTPVRCSRNGYCPFQGAKQPRYRAEFRYRSEYVFAEQHRRSQEKGRQGCGEWRPCAMPGFARGHRLTRQSNLNSPARTQLCPTYPHYPQPAAALEASAGSTRGSNS